MPTNFYMLFVAALIPLAVGFLYYGDFLFGKTWKKVNGFTDEYLAEANMGVVMGVSYLFCCIIALLLTGMVMHQGHVLQLMLPEINVEGSEARATFMALMAEYGDHHRSFGHGALHGGVTGLLFVLPLIGVNALFERRGWKYIFIHGGYWFITLTLMGGLLCSTLEYAPLT